MSATFQPLASYEDLEPDLWPAPIRGQIEAQLEQLKQRLLGPVIESIANTDLVRELHHSANEAAALAWLTVYPILVLPTLLEEKVRATVKRWEKQERVTTQCADKKPMRRF